MTLVAEAEPGLELLLLLLNNFSCPRYPIRDGSLQEVHTMLHEAGNTKIFLQAAAVTLV